MVNTRQKIIDYLKIKKNKVLLGFCVGFIVATIGIKLSWGPGFTWATLMGPIIIGGSIVGGVFSLIVSLISR